jgi:hypothetical protein
LNKTRLAAASVLIAAALASCKSGSDKVATFGPSTTRSTDTTEVTLPGAASSTSRSGINKTTTSLNPATLVKETGTTALSTKPNTDHLAMPRPGRYAYRDTVSGGNHPGESDMHFDISVNGQVVRVQQSQVLTNGGATYYEETHRSDGLFLTNSVIAGNSCAWSPPAASLPQAVIDGGTASTKSVCSVKLGAPTYNFNLAIDLAFKRLRTVSIGGKEYRCIDITRRRVFTNSEGTETVDATDTYAFALGLRIATDEHVVAESADKRQRNDFNHKTLLTALPS